MATGIGAVAWLPRLPSPLVLAIAMAGSAIIAIAMRWLRRSGVSRIARRAGRAQFFLVLGFAWGCAYGYHIRSGLLSAELEQQPLLLSGRIVGLVEQRESFARRGESAQTVLQFQFAVDATQRSSTPLQLPRRVQLNWYAADGAMPRPGERWQLRVRLKRPRGFANPGGFDYAAWLVANRLGATGYVERSLDNRALAPAPWYSLDALRGRAQQHLQQRLQRLEHRGLLLGLLIGDDGAIAAAQWELFRATGTVHLFVVSGLQIAFTGGIALGCARLWWRSAWCASRRRNYAIGVIPALLIALMYALLAGWGVPIQRAFIMFAVLLGSLVAHRQLRAATGWIAALWLVLLFDPLAVRDIGFWFSFVAVAAILAIICGHRSAPASPLQFHIARWWRVQLALFVTSLPLLLIVAGQCTLLALPANAVAIPLSTFVSLPLAFLALPADGIAPGLGDWLWRCADGSLDALWRYLQWLQGYGKFAIWHVRGATAALSIFAALAAALLLLPRALPGRGFASILLVPLLAPPLPKMAHGDYTVTAIDVGQGLSVLVETAQHRLLYDTGALFAPGRAVADITVVPLLRRRGIDALDSVIVSHDDSDHAGGWPALAREFRVDRLLVGEALRDAPGATRCRAGMRWQWDGVSFEILHPAAHTFDGNNSSCVLQIGTGAPGVLLTGDIERSAEYRLLDNPALQPAAVLFAPHHGSRSSSTTAFIERVQPRYVVFSTGYLNRFRHPSVDVVQRYRQSGAMLFDTATSGALTFTFGRGGAIEIAQQRTAPRHYWD